MVLRDKQVVEALLRTHQRVHRVGDLKLDAVDRGKVVLNLLLDDSDGVIGRFVQVAPIMRT